eukprot:3669189-Ditylum_brightwellii.AAC.1
MMHYFKNSTQANCIFDVSGYGTLWFHKKDIVNMLLLSKVKQKYQVTYNYHGKEKFIVHKPGY